MTVAIRTSGATQWIAIPEFDGGGVGHLFGTRTLCERRWPDDGAPIVSAKQAHGTRVAVIRETMMTREDDVAGHDALVTDRAGLAVGVSTADCVPIFLHDSDRGAVGAVHAGWRGAAAGILEATLGEMARSFGTRPASLRVAIGPHIGGCCYRVGADVWDAVDSRYRTIGDVFRVQAPGDRYLVLETLVRRQALDLGVRGDRIYSTGLCTSCRKDLFHSYRRDGRILGGMISAVRLEG